MGENSVFEKDINIFGKHASYMQFLTDKTGRADKSSNRAGIFNRNVDVLMVAPIFGLLNNRMAEVDHSVDEKSSILMAVLIKEKSNLEFVYNLVMLNDTTKGYTPDQKINFIFRENGDFELFMKYVRGGIEYLYEYFSDGTSTKSDYYEKIVSLIDEIQIQSIDDYGEALKELTKVK